jgi:hypothetical protein
MNRNPPSKRVIIRKKVDINNSHFFSKIKKIKRKKRANPTKIFVEFLIPLQKRV